MKYFLILFLAFFLVTNCSSHEENVSIDEPQTTKRIIAYVISWEDNWGEDFEKANQINHINYAFANIKNGLVVEGGSSDSETLKKLNELKSVNKELKILISIGGWSWSKNFSDAALTKDSREKFALSAIVFMQKHKIDGIDLVSEGILTLGRISTLLDDNSILDEPEDTPAGKIIQLFIDNDEIYIIVGTKVNNAHQDPTLPVELEIRRNVMKRIAHLLESKFLKRVILEYL